MTTEESTLESLLASITYETWFEYLPIIADAYRDAGKWDEAEAVGKMIREEWIPAVSQEDSDYWNLLILEGRLGELLVMFITGIMTGRGHLILTANPLRQD